ncbi:MAG: hypothetical protein ACJAW2_002079 [Shewanella sp.]|jgi:hypothetical protein
MGKLGLKFIKRAVHKNAAASIKGCISKIKAFKQ